jgi:hypothetical protein
VAAIVWWKQLGFGCYSRRPSCCTFGILFCGVLVSFEDIQTMRSIRRDSWLSAIASKRYGRIAAEHRIEVRRKIHDMGALKAGPTKLAGKAMQSKTHRQHVYTAKRRPKWVADSTGRCNT